MQNIPTVDLNQNCPSSQSIDAIGQSLMEWGFVNLTGHTVPSKLIQDAYSVAQDVFNLPKDVKHLYQDQEYGRQRGYTPFLLEKAKGMDEGDLKEFWHIGRTLPLDHPTHLNHQMRPNLFPNDVPQFQTIMTQLYQALDQVAFTLLDVITSFFDYPKEIFDQIAHQGNSVLRVLHYPDLNHDAYPGKVRAAAHEDINLLTLLPAATQPGLQLLSKQNEWIDVDAPLGSLVCDTGDMMHLLTHGELPANTHRVVNPEGGSDGGRLSMPFFMHPHPQAQLVPIGTDQAGISAQEFLNQRLRENGL
jgi:isopenicillin N synthase-like dioxygenase